MVLDPFACKSVGVTSLALHSVSQELGPSLGDTGQAYYSPDQVRVWSLLTALGFPLCFLGICLFVFFLFKVNNASHEQSPDLYQLSPSLSHGLHCPELMGWKGEERREWEIMEGGRGLGTMTSLFLAMAGHRTSMSTQPSICPRPTAGVFIKLPFTRNHPQFPG